MFRPIPLFKTGDKTLGEAVAQVPKAEFCAFKEMLLNLVLSITFFN